MSLSPSHQRARTPLPPAEKLTPMFRQWQQAKQKHPDALLLFRMGDFYELFFDDAEIAAPILEIALTTRGKGTACAAPMCGVPHHAANAYVARLVERGHRVAICEQMEDPSKVKGMVRRDVVRVVSPGTYTDPKALDPSHGNFLAAICTASEGAFGLAIVDLSTGALTLSETVGGDALKERLLRDEVKEALVEEGQRNEVSQIVPEIDGKPILVTAVDASRFDPRDAADRVRSGLGVATLSGFGCRDDHLALPAAAAALEWLFETQRIRPAHVDRLTVEREGASLELDESTRRNLELTRNLRDGSRSHTLLDLVDRSRSPLGARLVRQWLLEPSRDLAEIGHRHGIVEDLVGRSDICREMRESLRNMRDIERLLGRAALGSATPYDLLALLRSIETLPSIAGALAEIGSIGSTDLADRLDMLDDLGAELARAIEEEPSANVGDGRVLREGFDKDLDEVRSLARGGRETIAAMESRERERTGISSLKIKYNKVFGYFIEVSKSNLSKVPSDYERRQTISTGERYVTDELRDLESRILSAEERLSQRERELFERLIEAVTARASRLRETAAVVAEIDALAGFAALALEEGYVRPSVDDGDEIVIEEGRHPVVERLLPLGSFVPNDVRLDAARRLLIVTGPNMGGKSTYLRQVALIVLLAQAGSFVPARAARIAVVDRIFCRVGASDNLAGGESTFMVEMTETSNILHNATPSSLVILDEIGRGTATWDGLAIAWAVVESLHDDERLRSKALFATHYHELTALAASLPRVANVHIEVKEHGDEIVLLHRVEEGPSDRSYGIHVARLAGLPDRVVARAREILERLSSEERPAAEIAREEGGGQLPLFTATAATSPTGERASFESEAVASIADLDPDELSPRDAHRVLAELIEKLRSR